MASLLDSFSRRHLLAGAGLASAILAHHRLRSAVARQPVEHGDCALIPAMQWYTAFQRAQFLDIPNPMLTERPAGERWIPTQDPEAGPFLVPEGWTTDNFFANEFDRSGAPVWGADPLDHPRWTATMVTSPDQNAFFMMINAAVDNVAVDSQGGANLARDLAIGPEVETEQFCLMEQVLTDAQIPMAVWVSGETFAEHLIMTNGQSIAADFAGMNGGPGSRVVANVLVCPSEESDDYMANVFMPIMWQFVPRDAGGSDPTPTPSPTPW